MKNGTTSTGPSPVIPLQTATNQQLGTKFLDSLSIETKLTQPVDEVKNSAISAAAAVTESPPPFKSHGFSKDFPHFRSEDLAITKEPLKYNREEDIPVADPCKRRKTDESDDISTAKRAKKTCKFNEVVNVVPIPMRTEYSNRVRSRLWSTAVEIHQNAARNTIEFAAEGWDWRTVAEDESMYVCVATGELVHPIHYEMQMNSET